MRQLRAAYRHPLYSFSPPPLTLSSLSLPLLLPAEARARPAPPPRGRAEVGDAVRVADGDAVPPPRGRHAIRRLRPGAGAQGRHALRHLRPGLKAGSLVGRRSSSPASSSPSPPFGSEDLDLEYVDLGVDGDATRVADLLALTLADAGSVLAGAGEGRVRRLRLLPTCSVVLMILSKMWFGINLPMFRCGDSI